MTPALLPSAKNLSRPRCLKLRITSMCNPIRDRLQQERRVVVPYLAAGADLRSVTDWAHYNDYYGSARNSPSRGRPGRSLPQAPWLRNHPTNSPIGTSRPEYMYIQTYLLWISSGTKPKSVAISLATESTLTMPLESSKGREWNDEAIEVARLAGWQLAGGPTERFGR